MRLTNKGCLRRHPLLFHDLIADMMTVILRRFIIMDCRLSPIGPMRIAHLWMYREQITLHEHQVIAPIIRVQAVVFYPLSRFKPTLLSQLLSQSRHPLSPMRLVYYMPSIGKRLRYYPLRYNKSRSQLALMRNRDMNAHRALV